MRTNLLIAAPVLALAACSPEPTNLQNVAATPDNMVAPAANAVEPARVENAASPAARDYAGRWTGVEGMYLDVKPAAEAGRYRLTMQYDLDHKQTVDARLEDDDLVFERDGKKLALTPTQGAATGLKYLADKKDCLTVAPGEGYCRD